MIKLKWVGVVSMLAGILGVLSWILNFSLTSEQHSGSMYYFTTLSDLAGMILFIFTLLGFYFLYQDVSAQWYKHLSLFVCVMGTALFLGDKWVSAFVMPFLESKAPDILKTDPSGMLAVGMNLSFLLFAVGVILVGILILVGNKVPKYVGVILLLAPIIDFVPAGDISLGQIIFAIAIFLVGLSMLKQKVAVKN